MTIKTDVPRPRSTTCSSTARSSPASWSRRSTCATTRSRRSAPSCSARCARSRRTSSGPRSTAASARARGSARTGSRRRYDKYLRGTDGFTRVIVNSFGNRDDTRRTTRTDPIQGRQLRLTLDLGLQRAAQNAVARALDAAHGNGNPADAGAFVAMDPRNGEVLALGSYPSFDANLFAKPIDQETLRASSTATENGAPLFNRAISAGYPTGSTFKPITAFAAVDNGIITPSTMLDDPGVFEYGGREFKNAGDAVVRRARAAARAAGLLRRVLLPARARPPTSAARCIQDWARKLSFGRPTGIDLPGEYGGLVPDAQVAQRRVRGVPAVREEGQGRPRARPRRCTRAAASSAAGAAATTSTSPSARATCRRRRCSSRPRTPRSPTAAASSRRTSASRSRTAPAASSRRSASRPSGASTSTRRRSSAIRDGLRAAAGEDGRHVGRRVRRLPVHRLRQDRHRRARARTPTSPGTRATSTTRSSRSSSWSRSRRAASAPRRPRRPRA